MALRIWCAVLLTAFLGGAIASPGEAGQSPLAAYIASGDASHGWVERREGALGKTSYVELALVSQTWRGIPWKHQLFILKPSTLGPAERHAFLFIDGGRRKDDSERPEHAEKLPARAALFAAAAELMGSPLAVLRQVPYQPLFGGKTEDALIAHTFDRYLETGDPEWPLLLPMVKSAVRAMDAVQDYAARAWGLRLEKFTLAGASKRGWTSWLAGAVDERVAAIAPMAIDVLDIDRQLKYQQSVWGALSPKLDDYAALGLHERLDGPGGQALLGIVDPYRYLPRLDQAKLIMIGTNDAYWPLDALNHYWGDLPGRNFLLYLPGEGHSLGDYPRLVGGLVALHHHVAHGKRLPRLSWEFVESEGALLLKLGSDVAPDEVRAWAAVAPERDFRSAEWHSASCSPVAGAYQCFFVLPPWGYLAVFGEAVYEKGEPAPYFLSTNVRVVEVGSGG